jgi:hypothetical protein
MNRVSYLEVGSQFLRIEKNAGYVFVAVDAGNGRIVRFDIAARPDAPRWTRFLSSLREGGDPEPLGIIHPGNPALEEALDAVFKSVPRQLCVRQFLSALYQYLRSFQAHPLVPNTTEMRFYRAVSQLLKAPTDEQAVKLYHSLKTALEFAAPELENPLSWFQERFPLLTTHYRFPGMPPETWVADRALSEIMILLKAFPRNINRSSALEIIRAHAAEIEKTLNVEMTCGARTNRVLSPSDLIRF